MLPPYEPPRWLRNGHINTVACFLRPRRVSLAPAEPVWLRPEPGVELLLLAHWQPRPAPALLVVHGLEGSAEVGYMRTTAQLALAAGLHALRLNVRNCGGSEGRSATLYNSGMSGDVAAAVEWALAQPQVERLAMAGYSMGGNLVLKYAGEGGESLPAGVGAVAAVSPCLDLAACADALHRRVNYFYERRFLRGLRRRLRNFLRDHPHERGAALQAAAGRAGSVRAFDDVVTAPCTGYRDAADYYARAAAANWLHRIARPTLVLTAADDPFIVITPASRAGLAANPHILFVETQHGGHCSFLDRDGPAGPYWGERQIVAYCAGQLSSSQSPSRSLA